MEFIFLSKLIHRVEGYKSLYIVYHTYHLLILRGCYAAYKTSLSSFVIMSLIIQYPLLLRYYDKYDLDNCFNLWTLERFSYFPLPRVIPVRLRRTLSV